ncbi:hypothetical protein, partial [Halalkalibacter lacteus]|uniref:hypothetical protein n=1 Tax=Halalkalibacter lacteus TaxID=3090663 RepID=UPI002FC8B257
MNQTRLFRIFAWLLVATLRWMEWGKDKAAPATPDTPAVVDSAAVPGTARVPSADAAVPPAEGSL